MITAVLSGRFDPPHPGHVETTYRLIDEEKCDRVLIVVLDYPGRKACTAIEAKQRFDELFSEATIIVDTTINEVHFAEITIPQYNELLRNNGTDIGKAIYFSGNEAVIDHIKTLNIPHRFISRSGEWSGTEIRKANVQVHD